MDLFLNRKDAFYQNQSLWLEKPMVHLLPHWNLPGREGEPIRVVAYTNCPRVELLVNGVSQGIQAIDSCGHGQWQVEYHPGAIEAVAYAGDGTVAARERVETTGAPVRLRLRALTPAPRPDGKDVLLLNCDCLDAQGRPVPDASPMVHFVTNELGRVLATGSDVSDHTPRDKSRSKNAGRAHQSIDWRRRKERHSAGVCLCGGPGERKIGCYAVKGAFLRRKLAKWCVSCLIGLDSLGKYVYNRNI